ncbi:hypothetical protein [Roseivivax sp.]
MRIEAHLTALLLAAAPAAAQGPLSAIDWLSEDAPPVAAPREPRAGPEGEPLPRDEPPVADAVSTPDVSEATLGEPTLGAVGLLPSATTGLPPSLWEASEAERLTRRIAEAEAPVPAIAALINTLLLAEARPPSGAGDGAAFVAARAERLIANGSVDPALALLERAGPEHPDLFPLWFEASLLEGRLTEPCEALNADPKLTDDLVSDIFCAARQGDWPRAYLTFQTAGALDTLGPRDRDLLERFLDPELAGGLPSLPPPSTPSALQFQLFEAIGEPLPTGPLPRAFAATDLSGDQGWKAQIMAAERLARAGALSENRLLGIYTLRRPAASGGVWDRVEALQRFDIAMTARNPTSVANALSRIWPEMAEADLLIPFAALYGDRLMSLPLTGAARQLALQAGLLSESYERAAAEVDTERPEMRFLAAVARGAAPEGVPDLPHAAAIAAGFGQAAPPAGLQALLDAGRLGEAILRAIELFDTGAQGNDAQLIDAIATFRAVGLEDTARRAALQLALLSEEHGGR